MSHQISLQQAIDLTTRYRKEKDQILKPEYAGKNLLALSETYDRSAFEELLKQEGCVKIRAYFGMDENKNIKLLFVGANDKNEDMLPSDMQATAGGGASIQDIGQRCPPLCPPPGPLNPQP